MATFSRKPGAGSGPGRHTRSAASRRRIPETEVADITFAADERPALTVPDFGPYDVEVAPDDGLPRIDLGSLKVPNLPGIALGIETTQQGQPVRVQLEHEGSRLQISAFAAPRYEGIWDEVRAELLAGALGSGAKVVEVEGDYGPALAARLPDQSGGVVEVRHIGIDGPRWFLQAVLIGPAAVDPTGPLSEALRGVVVDRGADARPVREALPLQLPAELQARLAEAAAAQAARRAAGGAAASGAPSGAATARPATARPATARPATARPTGRGERA